MTVSDYLANQTITEKSQLTIVGTIKPRSVRLSRTALCKDFVLTDARNELECTYNGMVKEEFKEGETTLVQGYCPDLQHKNRIIVKDYFTKHGMETKEWQSKENVSRRMYNSAESAQLA